MTIEEKEHEMMRRDLWIKTFAAAIGCERVNTGVATECADNALKKFDERFKSIDSTVKPALKELKD